MIGYELPASVNIGGRDYAIRTDYRAILDIIMALNDPDLTDDDRGAVALGIFFRDELPEDLQAGIERCFWFISGGDEHPGGKPAPRLVDWEKDFRWIASPINRMLGKDIRAVDMHWWTFLSYYYEIGDCTFAQIVKIRSAKATGKKLDMADREWARKNADLINIETRLSAAESDMLAAWTKGGESDAAE